VFLAGGVYWIAALLTDTPADRFTELPDSVTWIAAAVLSIAAVGFYMGSVVLAERRYPKELAFRRALPELLIGIAISLAMMSAIVGLIVLGGWAELRPSPISGGTDAAVLALQTGILEELLFRAIMLRLVWRALGPWAALAASAALFGALHLYNPGSSWFASLCIMVEAGIMLAAFYILTGRLWVSIGVHTGWNFSQGWLFGAPVSGTALFEGGPFTWQLTPGAPAFITGGNFGPEASLPALIVGTATGAVTLWLCWKRGRLASEERAQPAP
jgi:membrane protease YdiL (CAAX protease family)